jgi:CYTH domain-containing protein
MPELKSGMEIERRFLLSELPDNSVLLTCERLFFKTVYLHTGDPELRLREVVNLADGASVKSTYSMAVKFGSGIIRYEVLNEIPKELFESRFPSGEFPVINKLRFKKRINGVVWEIDNFTSTLRLNGLYMAEVEPKSRVQQVVIPPWLKVEKEVTNDSRYNNKNLAVHGIPNPR